MLAISFLTFGLILCSPQQVPPSWSASEELARKQLTALGGQLEWITEEGKWQLSLDVDNKDRVLDCKVLKDLNRLYALRVFRGSVKEDSLAELKRLPNLGLVVILCAELSDQAVVQLTGCKAVNKLDIQAGRLKSETLRKIAEMPRLERLFLYNTKIRDEDLDPFRTMTALHDLTLPLSVSENGQRLVQSWLPKTRVTRI
jgi:hypothetical protein